MCQTFSMIDRNYAKLLWWKKWRCFVALMTCDVSGRRALRFACSMQTVNCFTVSVHWATILLRTKWKALIVDNYLLPRYYIILIHTVKIIYEILIYSDFFASTMTQWVWSLIGGSFKNDEKSHATYMHFIFNAFFIDSSRKVEPGRKHWKGNFEFFSYEYSHLVGSSRCWEHICLTRYWIKIVVGLGFLFLIFNNERYFFLFSYYPLFAAGLAKWDFRCKFNTSSLI